MNEPELLAALRADPRDDITRAVYADWLAERGDPRGEYLHLQLQLAKIWPRVVQLEHAIDPAWLDVASRRYDVVIVRARAMIHTIKAVRQVLGIGLAEAKAIVDAVAVEPQTLLRGVTLQQAADARVLLYGHADVEIV